MSNDNIYARRGDKITTENSNIPVYEFLRDVRGKDNVVASDFMSVCSLPEPKDGELILDEYLGEKFRKHKVTFHFNDGWRYYVP